MNKSHKNIKKGFTLLEILLVIAAIGILSAIVLVSINPNRQIAQVRNAQKSVDVNTIYKALEQYLIDNGSYPAGITEVEQDICINNNTTGCVNLGVLVPDYIASIPLDPTGGAYKVSINPANNKISVTASSAELSQTIAINPTISIIKDGLVMYLDAGNTESYPGTGTTWFDLSGNSNNGTLVNGVSYNNDNRGFLNIGNTSKVDLGSSIQNYSTFTTSFWVYFNFYDQREMPLGDLSQASGYHFFFLFGNVYLGFSSGFTGNPYIGVPIHQYKPNPYTPTQADDFYYNTWNHFAVTKDLNNNVVFYRNGVAIGGGNKEGVSNISQIGGGWDTDMRFPQLLFYNRALSSEEIQQNFNATKIRFGL
jgi:type II secretion system protein G